MSQQWPDDRVLHQLAQFAFFKTGTVFHRLFQHHAGAGVLVFQLFVYRFQFFYIRMLFQFGRHTVELFAVFDLFNLRFAFLVDLHVHFYAVYLFGRQVGEKFFD